MLKTIRWFAPTVASVALLACGNDGPGAAFIGGTWTGQYTNSAAYHNDQSATFVLSQSGSVVTGNISLSGGGVAHVSGTMSGSTLTATISFTGSCPGTATSQATIERTSAGLPGSSETLRLEGTYQLSDCSGATTGTYTLVTQ